MTILQKNSGWLLVSFLVLITGCVSYRLREGNASLYQLSKLKRRNKRSPPMVFGHIDQREPDGRIYPIEVAGIVADGVVTMSERTGYYARILSPGTHILSVKEIGLQTVSFKIRLNKGDSIRIDFHLTTDTTVFRCKG